MLLSSLHSFSIGLMSGTGMATAEAFFLLSDNFVFDFDVFFLGFDFYILYLKET